MDEIKLNLEDLDLNKLLDQYKKEVTKKDFPVGFQAPKRDK